MKLQTIACAVFLCIAAHAPAQTWNFAVSGDSRNCGDIVMPAIADDVKKNDAQFYWHMGDFRAIYAIDEDISQRATGGHPSSTGAYQRFAWRDAIDNQIKPFGDLPFFAGIGNHETIPPMTRDQFRKVFAKWLDAPPLRDQRKQDGFGSKDSTFYHWHQQGVDFIYLDNASEHEFDPEQMEWLHKVLDADSKDDSIKAVVVGMHAALPNSLAAGHSMNNWKTGEDSGDEVYKALLSIQNDAKKHVYVLASHSHFYMKNIFQTDYWESNGGVLPGWIVGTSGAHRYKLPPDANKAGDAKTNVYGYLLATVHDDGKIDFKFKEIKESAIPQEVESRFGTGLVHWCFEANSDQRR
ncbi:MAG TPA: hypothetical protein VGL89_08315 [Candidatus Koribacter sp.]|jgi:hypothetical protein